MQSDLEPKQDTEPAPSAPASEATLSLTARLFGVPLLIVVLIVGSVTVVVTAFGWIATGEERSIDDLVTVLEAGGGEKNALGMLAPRDKEYWQAAKELAERLGQDEVTAAERPAVARRLGALIERSDSSKLTDQGRDTFQLVMLALAALQEPAGIDVLTKQAMAGDPEIRRMAVQSLAEMRNVAEIGRAVPTLTRLVGDRVLAKEVRMVACNAIANIARSGVDRITAGRREAAVDALADAVLDEPEVSWNAALALGYLQSEKAVAPLSLMLDRSFWESQQVRHRTGGKMSEIEIRGYLLVAMDAASRVDDPKLSKLIAALEDDEDFEVGQRARELAAAAGSPAA